MKVTVLTIWNSEHAISQSSYYTTPTRALDALGDWVESMWDQERLGRSIDDDCFQFDTDRISYFFEKRSDDYQYDIKDKHVNGSEGGWEPPLGPDEILLDPGEIRVTIHALKYAARGTMALAFDKSVQECHNIVQDITEKLES